MSASTAALIAVACVGLAAALASCRACKPGAVIAESPAPLSQGATSAITEERVSVCRTQGEFAALWREHTRLQLPEPPSPEVDFGTHMVVAVFAGERPTAGYAVVIESVRAARSQDGGITVVAKETAPAEGSVQAQMVSSPFAMAAVDLAEGAAELDWAD